MGWVKLRKITETATMGGLFLRAIAYNFNKKILSFDSEKTGSTLLFINCFWH